MLKINRVKEAFHNEGIQISTKALNVLSEEAKAVVLAWVKRAKEDEDLFRVTPDFLLHRPNHVPYLDLMAIPLFFEKAESLLKSITMLNSHHQINERIQAYFDDRMVMIPEEQKRFEMAVSVEEQKVFDQIAHNYLMNNYSKHDNGLYSTAKVEELTKWTEVEWETNADKSDRGYYNPLTEKYQDEIPEQPTWIVEILYGRQDDSYNESWSLKIGVVKEVLDKFLEENRQGDFRERLCHWIQDVSW